MQRGFPLLDLDLPFPEDRFGERAYRFMIEVPQGNPHLNARGAHGAWGIRDDIGVNG